MDTHDPGKDDRTVHLTQIQQQIARGEYRVDAVAVAEAILRRMLDEPHAPAPWSQPQDECS
jgi:anti-sigma28 factor (negative regulator of flagellin synthesis)